jgi:hypothetical protein
MKKEIMKNVKIADLAGISKVMREHSLKEQEEVRSKGEFFTLQKDLDLISIKATIGLGIITWRKVPGYPFYEASSMGNIRSMDFRDFKGKLRKGKNLVDQNTSKQKSPYITIRLKDEMGKYKTIPIHIIIANTFRDSNEVEWDLKVHHIDKNKHNNRLNNLVFLSDLEHGKIHRKRKPGNPADGIKMTVKINRALGFAKPLF